MMLLDVWVFTLDIIKINAMNFILFSKYGKTVRVLEKKKINYIWKTCIFNSLAISKIIYVGSILPMPDPEYIKQLKKIIFNFIWNKRDGIKRDTVIGRQEDGGIGVVDIESKFKALKAAWCRILIDKTCIINKIVDSYLRILNVDINNVLNVSLVFLVSETNNSNFEMLNFLFFIEKLFVVSMIVKKKPLTLINYLI